MKAAAGANSTFPWNDLMAAGLGLLRLNSHSFWRMTLIELYAALGISRSSGLSMTRDELSGLMQQFPDITHLERADGRGNPGADRC